jgi:GNAT superfamily N-acetyltransferase
MAGKSSENTPRLLLRQAQPADVPQLVELTGRVYSPEWGHSAEMLRSQQTHFPEGQFVVEYEGRIVGYCATFRIDEATALAPHTWMQITGGGMGSRHKPDGNWLNGMEAVVHPDYRGMRIGQRLYRARKRLCMSLKLRGIVFGGRIPGLAKNIARYGSAEAYVQAVTEGRRRDPTLSFQLSNDFEVIGLLREYVPSDHESLGYAVHLVWRNPQLLNQPDTPSIHSPQGLRDLVRVASVQ